LILHSSLILLVQAFLNVYLSKNSTDLGSRILVNGLYKLNLDPIYEQSLFNYA